MGSQPFRLAFPQPFRIILGRHMCILILDHGPCQGCTEKQLLPLLSGVSNAAQPAVIQLFNEYHQAYNIRGLADSLPILLPSLHGKEGSSSPGLVPSNDIVISKCVVGIKCGDSEGVIGYEVD